MAMIQYKNLSGISGVCAYEIGVDFIVVEFSKEHKRYKYTDGSAGSQVIEQMKKLAQYGQGLNTFINKNKPPFVAKW
jgi:hypothetical protein